MRNQTTETTESRDKILVVGVGALGGVIGHEFCQRGHDVTLLTHDAESARVLRVSGLREVRSGHVVLPRVEQGRLPLGDQFDFVFLATQPTAVENVVADLPDVLSDRGRFVCLQNGLCEERVAKKVPANRVVGAVVSFGASAHGPGLCERTSSGGFVVGNLDGALDETLERLAHLLGSIGPVRTTTNLRGIRWSKLAINCAISTLGTIGGERLGVLLRLKSARALALQIMREAVEVATALGITLERLTGIPPLEWLLRDIKEGTVRERIEMAARHGLAMGVGTRYRWLRSSMLRAIEQGKPPAVDFLNGEITERGKPLNVSTKANQLAQNMVWSIARGERKPGLPLIEGMATELGL
jgi:2-dehydropantoate 2-reductase